MADPRPASILVLGGGTAGWMSANILKQRWPATRVTVLESPEIGIIGVGEGSTPQLKAFFDSLGLAERDWMPACHATYKLGIEFRGWSRRPGFERYFHHFPSQVDEHTAAAFLHACSGRRQGLDLHGHPDRYFLNARLAAQRQGPHPDHNFPFLVSYGYHFDSYLLGGFLRDFGIRRGIEHHEGTVAEVELTESGEVAALKTSDGRGLAADLYVDCSGFRAVIHQQALGVRFLPFASNLYNDAAVVMPTPADAEGPECQTVSTALRKGWVFRIPLTHRNGNGYVYSSRYCAAEEAEAELRAHLGLTDSAVSARHLKMRVGRVEHTWQRNSLAVGLSQGFIEPLEATALHLVLETVWRFADAIEAEGEAEARRQAYNTDIARRIEGIRDYIHCHYRVSQRDDTDYWRDCASNDALSPSLRKVLEAWFHGENVVREIHAQGIQHYYTPVSWHCLLGGYGTYPDDTRIRKATVAETRWDLQVIDDFIARCALNFRSHKEQLAELAGH